MTWTITIEKISTGERSSSMIVRCGTEQQAREHAAAGIAQSPIPDDYRVVAIAARSY